MEANAMFASLSDVQLEAAITKYATMPSIVNMLKAEQERRVKGHSEALQALEAKAVAEAARIKLEAGITKLANKHLPKPSELQGVKAIVFIAKEIEDTSQQAEEVEIIDEPAVTNSDGSIIKPAVKHTETRYPKVLAWEYQPNADWSSKPESKASTPSRRKVKKVYRKEPDGSLTPIPSPTPITTWREWGKYLNSNPHLLHPNANGSPVEVIETTASGLVDLRTAGFIGIEES